MEMPKKSAAQKTSFRATGEILSELGIAEDFSNLKAKEMIIKEPDPDELKRWMNELGKKLRILRRMRIEKEDLEPIFEILKEDKGFDEIQKHKAELWIIKGDWRYKKEVRLELSDFYPKPEYIEHFFKGIYRGEDVIGALESMKSVMGSRRRLELELLKNEYEEKMLLMDFSDRSRAVTGMAKEVAQWMEKCTKLEKELKQARADLTDEKRKNEKHSKMISELELKADELQNMQELTEQEYKIMTNSSVPGLM